MRPLPATARAGRAAIWSATALALLGFATRPAASADLNVFTSAATAEVEKKLATDFSQAIS